jgi:hypothetical protein
MQVRPVSLTSIKERNFVTHVEADESAYDAWPASGARTSQHVYPERSADYGK